MNLLTNAKCNKCPAWALWHNKRAEAFAPSDRLQNIPCSTKVKFTIPFDSEAECMPFMKCLGKIRQFRCNFHHVLWRSFVCLLRLSMEMRILSFFTKLIINGSLSCSSQDQNAQDNRKTKICITFAFSFHKTWTFPWTVFSLFNCDLRHFNSLNSGFVQTNRRRKEWHSFSWSIHWSYFGHLDSIPQRPAFVRANRDGSLFDCSFDSQHLNGISKGHSKVFYTKNPSNLNDMTKRHDYIKYCTMHCPFGFQSPSLLRLFDEPNFDATPKRKRANIQMNLI